MYKNKKCIVASTRRTQDRQSSEIGVEGSVKATLLQKPQKDTPR